MDSSMKSTPEKAVSNRKISDEIDEPTLKVLVRLSDDTRDPVHLPPNWYRKNCYRCRAPLNNSHYTESVFNERLCTVCLMVHGERNFE